MSYVNQFDKAGECAAQGANAEKTFKDILIAEGGEVKEATFAEQMTHVDFIVNKNNAIFRYDVKARKRVSRNDSGYQDDLIWIEIQSVSGELGWLFGVADFIVFERALDFVVVERKKLENFVKVNCNFRKIAFTAKEALYCKYQRRGRKDCLTLIKGFDIEAIAKKIIKK